ncbi:MAG TPA: glycosyltransferase family 2 protein [Anaerolineae bacterium]|nr:glycosyltransferase family 2 protein [Anaerolineae bacterium]
MSTGEPCALAASVIVLGYNGRDLLQRCLESALDQSFAADEFEVIYADNASQDGSAGWVSEHFPSARLLCFDRNLGFAEGNNRAAAHARGRYLLFLNQDTVVHRHWLAEMVGALASGPEVDEGFMPEPAVRTAAGHAAGCPLQAGAMERDGRVSRGFLSEITRFGAVEPVEIDLPDTPIATLHIGGGSMILDRQVLHDLDYIFDATLFAYGEDLDLGLRLNGLGYRVVFVPTAICYHHREGRAEPSRTTLRRTALATRNRFLVYMKNMHWGEFLLALPLLFVGSIAKMGTMVASPVKRLIYGVGLIPFTAYYLAAAIVRMPRYLPDRRRILARRDLHHPRSWLLRELLRRGRR